jgi:hypothetical protein
MARAIAVAFGIAIDMGIAAFAIEILPDSSPTF